MLERLAGSRPRLMVEVTAAAAVLLVTAVLAATPPTEGVSGVAIRVGRELERTGCSPGASAKPGSG